MIKNIISTGLTLLMLVGNSAVAAAPSVGLLPDLQTVVPQHLGIVNEHQRKS